MVIKKTKRNNKNKRKTKRKQTGGKIYEVTQYSNNNSVLLFNILQEIPYWKSKHYNKMVLSNTKFKIVPFFSNFSIHDFLPELDGEEADLINIFTGNPIIDPKLKTSMIYSHSTKDSQLFKLNELFLQQITLSPDFRKAVISVLTRKDLYKKILCLRILVYIYLGKNGIPDNNGDINEQIEEINSIDNNPIFQDNLSVDVIPQQENGKTYYQKDFNYIKSTFKLNNDVTQIFTNIYSNELLPKCYEDITDDDIVFIMNRLPPDNRVSYKLVYSENNRRTYDNIRYILLNTSIISKDLTGMVNMDALITPDKRENARIEEIARREEVIRNTALIAVLAANEQNRPPIRPPAIVPPIRPPAIAPPAENDAIIAAIVAANEQNRQVVGAARAAIRAAAEPDANNAIIAALVANEQNQQGPFARAVAQAAAPNGNVPVIAALAAMENNRPVVPANGQNNPPPVANGQNNNALLPGIIAAGIVN